MPKNITYLLGAGSSANTIPIVGDIRTRIIEVYSTLKMIVLDCGRNAIELLPAIFESNLDVLNTIIEKFEWLIKETGEYYTIDTLAKKFYLTDDNGKYEKLKECLIIYFTIEQLVVIPSEKKPGYNFHKHSSDLRYGSFITAIARRGSDNLILNENVKILSWNYDMQLELTLKKFSDKRINSINVKNNIFPQINSNQTDVPHEKGFCLRKLNGHAVFTTGTKQDNELTVYDIGNPNNDLYTNLGIFLDDYKNLKFSNNTACRFFNFAWEQNDDFEKEFKGRRHKGYLNHIKEAESIAKDTEILVVIGYSFPIFNREIDNRLFKAMNGSLKKVYIQDMYPQKIESTMKNAFEIFQKQPILQDGYADQYIESTKINFHLEDNLNQFVIPFELHQ